MKDPLRPQLRTVDLSFGLLSPLLTSLRQLDDGTDRSNFSFGGVEDEVKQYEDEQQEPRRCTVQPHDANSDREKRVPVRPEAQGESGKSTGEHRAESADDDDCQPASRRVGDLLEHRLAPWLLVRVVASQLTRLLHEPSSFNVHHYCNRERYAEIEAPIDDHERQRVANTKITKKPSLCEDDRSESRDRQGCDECSYNDPDAGAEEIQKSRLVAPFEAQLSLRT